MTSSTGGGEGRWPFEPTESAPGGGQPGGGAGWTPTGAPVPPAQSAPAVPYGAQPTRRSAREAVASTPGGPAQSGVAGFGATQVGALPPQEGAGGGEPPASGATGRDGRRRPPVWLLVLIGLVVVGGVVAAVLLLGGEKEPEVLPGATVTLPVPTPTVDAIEREPGTPFADALPSEVLQFALSELGEDPGFLAAGALESYRLVYTDGGGTTLTVLAGQWRDEAGPQARLDAVLAELGDVPEASDAPADDDAEAEGDDASAEATEEPLPSPVQGPVLVDGQEVGRYVFEPRADGTGTLWWTNTTVFLQLDGPWAELMDVFTAYAL